MNFNLNRRPALLDDIDDLAGDASGGPLKMWLAGVGVALVPIVYGVRCLIRGEAHLFGRGSSLDVTGPEAACLAVAYIAVGAFLHFHWFWGLHPRLHPFSELFKILAALVFIPAFGAAMLKIIA